MTAVREVPNDAHLAQLVRGALGSGARKRGEQRINVSSCGRIITLHGVARGQRSSREIEEVVRRTPGVLGVINKLTLSVRRNL